MPAPMPSNHTMPTYTKADWMKERVHWVRPDAERLEGVRYGPWVFVKCLGGHSADVWLVANGRHQAALKFFPRADLDDTCEPDILGALRGVPGIVQQYDAWCTYDSVYILLEYASGGTLADLIKQHGPAPPLLVRHYFQQIILAVRRCHLRGIYHLDLKPSNILVHGDGDVRLADFGSAVFQDWQKAGVCGTVGYASPEIEMETCYRASQADVWSLGVILLELLHGGNIFFGPHRDKSMSLRHARQGYHRIPDHVQGHARELVGGMLQREPMDRIKLDEILRHPWFSADLNAPTSDAKDPTFIQAAMSTTTSNGATATPIEALTPEATPITSPTSLPTTPLSNSYLSPPPPRATGPTQIPDPEPLPPPSALAFCQGGRGCVAIVTAAAYPSEEIDPSEVYISPMGPTASCI
ncbi:hypothetical protein IAT38_001931 [Cryptococcus sp. DSM 104549]